jgi:hypothetical protein
MVLGVSVEALIVMVGHDGSEIIWPKLPEPSRRKGFHLQELIDIAFDLGWASTPFDARPVSRGEPPHILTMKEDTEARMARIMTGQPGVATGYDMRGRPHAVAWDGQTVHDCNQKIRSLSEFGLQTFWALTRRR